MEKIRKTADFEVKIRLMHCDRCLEALNRGQGYYQLAGKIFCRECLSGVAEALFLPFLQIAGEEAGPA